MTAIDLNYRECDGVKGGKLYTSGDGFFYCKNFKRQGVYEHLVWKTKMCRGSSKIVTSAIGVNLIPCSPHSDGCAPDINFEKEIDLRKRILAKCREETSPLIRIFQEECNRWVKCFFMFSFSRRHGSSCAPILPCIKMKVACPNRNKLTSILLLQ